jgi:hypothetical protein
MFRHEVVQYWRREYTVDKYVCEKCKFTLFIDSSSRTVLDVLHTQPWQYMCLYAAFW